VTTGTPSLQTHALADFGEAIGVIGGVERKIHFFAMDLPHSDAIFVVGYPAETTEAFCDGHVRAFAFFDGVPQSILYDNLWTPPAQGDLFGVGGVECTNLSGLLLERSCPWP
jgi:transposase